MDILECLVPLPTPLEVRQWDRRAMALGVPEFTLMENAGRAALHVLLEVYGSLRGKRVLLFMGNGNNGGDAACLARHLLDVGSRPLLLHTMPLHECKGTEKETAGQHLRLAKACGVPLRSLAENASEVLARVREEFATADILVDGLLGTGFQGELRQQMRVLTVHINDWALTASPPFVLALDVPSGLDALTGRADADAVRAKVTVSFASAKPGLVLPESLPYTGRVFARSIGIPALVQSEIPASFRLLDRQCAALLPPTPVSSYKNAFGHVLVVGGSPGLTGAAHLSALAALRAGAGLVSAAAPMALAAEIKGGMSDIMTVPLGTEGQSWPDGIPNALLEAVQRASALVIGPGMGRSTEACALMRALLEEKQRPPAVLDADAFNMLASQTDMLALLRADDVLTPHPGEAGKLLGMPASMVQENRQHCLRRLAALAPCCWVLKGAGTLVTQENSPTYISPYDVPTLAVGGSGDVLAGCIAALMGRTKHSMHATLLAVAAHARAGCILLDTYPLRGNLANNIAHALPAALASLDQLPELCRVDH